MKKKQLETLLYSVAGVAIMFLIVVAANVIASIAKTRVDMTADKLYTLSDGTKEVLKKLDGVVEIRYYVTEGEKEMPLALKTYAQRVEDLLSELRQNARGNIEIKKFNPKPDSDAEDSAQLDGIEGQMLPNGEQLYLGIAVSYLDGKASLPFLSPEREKLLEYDITRAITRVFNPQKPVVGVMSTLPIFGMPMNPMMMRMNPQGAQDPWVFIGELKRDFNVKEVPMDTDKIDEDIKVLVVVHPRDISEKAQYAIDQFVMRGGKLIAFLDSQAITDTKNAQQQNPMMPNMGANSNLDKLLKTWGLQFDTTKVAADMKFITRIVRNNRQEAIPAVLSLNPEGISRDDVSTSQLDSMLMPFAGVFTGTPAAGLKQTVLIHTTTDSQLVEGFMAQMSGEQVVKDFKSSGTAYALAVRLDGKFKSAFPEGKPKEAPKDPDDKDAKKDDGKPEESLKESKGETAVILVGDADMLSDNFSVQIQNFFGQKIVIPRNGNLSFVQNITEQMSGDISLIKMRSRATQTRPFTVVQQMQSEAESRYRTKIKDLETSLQETQQKLNELQAKKDKGQQRILSAEQQAEIKNFKEKEAVAKRELKEVRRNLRQDIDSLENRLKWMNIAGMPVLVTVFGIVLAMLKRSRTQAR